MTAFAPFPIENEIERLFRGPAAELIAESQPNRGLYLRLAAAGVDAALDWLDADGRIIDPFDAEDRWRGGAAARFACPAAILARHAGRGDLIEPVRRALDQLCRAVSQANDENDRPFPPGVMDLIAKEILVAREQIGSLVGSAKTSQWDAALAGLNADAAYTLKERQSKGARFTNYEAYSAAGEWLRTRMGLADSRSWVDVALEGNLPWTTAYGMYRDPGDPCTYDLSVRQNWSELLHYGYDGPWAERVSEVLRRGGLTTLLMTSPNGWGPYGGRSNLFVHNEAMLAYIAEFEARRYRRMGRGDLAGAFKQTARRAAIAAAHFFCDLRPLRHIKNRFPPASQHGRDKGYAEYSTYALLAASLFARAYLIADDGIPERAEPGDRRAFLLHLFPEFHRTFAACGDTHVQLDTRAQLEYDATGVGRFHRVGAPEALGMSCPVAGRPRYVAARGREGRAAAIGPAWQGSDGRWRSLASCSEEIADVHLDRLCVRRDEVRWRLRHDLRGLAARRVIQTFSLRPGRLHIETQAEGDIDAIALEAPLLAFDGEREAQNEVERGRAVVRFRGARLEVTAADAERVHLDDEECASREAAYRVAAFQKTGRAFAAEWRLDPA